MLEEGNCIIALVAEVHQLVIEIANLHLQVLLELFFLFLFIGDLSLEIQFKLSLSFSGLSLEFTKSLFKSLFL